MDGSLTTWLESPTTRYSMDRRIQRGAPRDDGGGPQQWRYAFVERVDVTGRVPLRATGDWQLPPTTGRWFPPQDYTYCARCDHPAFYGGRCAKCESLVKRRR